MVYVSTFYVLSVEIKKSKNTEIGTADEKDRGRFVNFVEYC